MMLITKMMMMNLIRSAVNFASASADRLVREQTSIRDMCALLQPALELRKVQWVFNAVDVIQDYDVDSLRAVLETYEHMENDVPLTVTDPLRMALSLLTAPARGQS